MSRPCFALSVMLCCMAGPLLIIGKAQAQDKVISPSHDPVECIICPLAHGPLDVCGGYSDYDYNQYWHDSTPLATAAPTPQCDPEFEVVPSLVDDSAVDSPETSYEDYYADYVFGGDSTTTPDEAYEALSESASESYSDEEFDGGHSSVTWGDEDEWYREEYGYEGTPEATIAEDSTAIESEELLQTGYDKVYDAAMAPEWKATEPVADAAPSVDDYESFYDAYDDLYNFESAALESSGFESSGHEASEVVAESVTAELNEQLLDSAPAWLTDLVTRMLSPVWMAAQNITSENSMLVPHAHTTTYVDECAQEWDCEADYWSRPQPEQPSLVLGAADTLDGIASLFQDAAEGLRALAKRSVSETARVTEGNSPR